MFNAILIRCFPKDSPLHKLFNKGNTKISYSCTPNMMMIISAHNKKMLKHQEDKDRVEINAKPCNCRGGTASCPVQGECQRCGVIYHATVRTEGTGDMFYTGAASTSFKTRYNNHKTSMVNQNSGQKTTLSTYYWSMKNQGRTPIVSFKIVKSARPYTPETGKCTLCNMERVLIMMADPKTSLNRRTEVLAKCRHRAKYLLANFKEVG
jgi:hypothetical protein